MENQNSAGSMQSAPSAPGQAGKNKKAGLGWAIIVGIILIVLILVILDRVVGVNIFTSDEQRQQQEVTEFLNETGAWHAVFLTNGQVYFGQLSDPEAQFATLNDVYYLQLQQAPTPAPTPQVDSENPDAGAQVIEAPAPQPPQLTLIKFGTELHGPQDFMRINRDHILFWEELKADSQVVQAIVNYKNSQ
jgi:hypothetical protein